MRALLFILTAWAGLYLAPALAQEAAPAPISKETCKTCHGPYEEHKVNVYHNDCLACHTPEPKHVVEGGKGTVRFPTADKCLACHKNNDPKRMNWAFCALEGRGRIATAGIPRPISPERGRSSG
jgi:hypothetical protein